MDFDEKEKELRKELAVVGQEIGRCQNQLQRLVARENQVIGKIEMLRALSKEASCES